MNENPIRLLLVEDNAAEARLMEIYLVEDIGGFELQWVERLAAAEAFLKGEDRPVDGVLLDLSLPDSYGLATFTRVQALAPSLPIIVLSGQDDDGIAEEAVRSGAQDYLVKSQMDGRLLARSIRYAVERKRLELRLSEAGAVLREARAQRVLSALVQGLAHEVRNPLFAIDLNVSVLEKFSDAQHALQPFAAHIRHHVRRLDGLMRDLMELGKPLEAKDFVQEDLSALVIKSARLLLDSMPEARSRLVVENPDVAIPVVCVPEKVTLALVHIFSNALEHSPADARVKAEILPQEDGGTVRVSDAGPGIPEEMLDRLFEPFVTSRQGRPGLGLALVRHYIESHGGTVSAMNRTPGGGAVFTVSLPGKPSKPQSIS